MANKLIDITGQKFGKLTVLERSSNTKYNQTRWLCQCDCGNKIIVIGNDLKRGTTRSCGCFLKEDLKGRKFGRLLVIRNVKKPKNLKGTGAYWKCLCECGNIVVVSARSLKSENTKSCGCFRSDLVKKTMSQINRIGFGESAFNRIYNDYKRTAKRRNIEFNLSKEYFKFLVKQDCYYCGVEPIRIIKTTANNGSFICNGIDRVDNSKGYIKGNVVSCCKRCNQSKNNMTIQEFLDWINHIYNHSIRLRKVGS